MLLRENFCIELRLIRVDLKNLEFFNGVLLHSCVAMVKHFGQFEPFRANCDDYRASNLIVFDRQWTTFY